MIYFKIYYLRRKPRESNLKFGKMKRELYRLRDKKYPKRPTSHSELQDSFKNPEVLNEYGRTLDDSNKLYVGSIVEENYSFHSFASLATIDLIQEHIPPEQRKYLIDGTFSIVPKMCYQLLIIAVEYKNDVMY